MDADFRAARGATPLYTDLKIALLHFLRRCVPPQCSCYCSCARIFQHLLSNWSLGTFCIIFYPCDWRLDFFVLTEQRLWRVSGKCSSYQRAVSTCCFCIVKRDLRRTTELLIPLTLPLLFVRDWKAVIEANQLASPNPLALRLVQQQPAIRFGLTRWKSAWIDTWTLGANWQFRADQQGRPLTDAFTLT